MTTGKAATGVFLPAMAFVGLTGMALMLPSPVAAVSMTDYTSSPPSATNSPSVLASSFTGEGAIFQAFFFAPPSVNCGPTNPNEVRWTGLMQGLGLPSRDATGEGYSTSPISGNMSQGGSTCRRILTWADFDNDGLVGSSERIEFRCTPLVLSRL